jgi:hypothetical protein
MKTTKSAPQPPPARKRLPKGPPPRDHLRAAMTGALGVGIPLLSLAMSKLAGTLASHSVWDLAALAFALMVAVLGVSLGHLSAAIADVTHSGPWTSWALAVVLDLSLVLCELCHVYADHLGLAWVCYAVMGCVASASMALNVWGFNIHAK